MTLSKANSVRSTEIGSGSLGWKVDVAGLVVVKSALE